MLSTTGSQQRPRGVVQGPASICEVAHEGPASYPASVKHNTSNHQPPMRALAPQQGTHVALLSTEIQTQIAQNPVDFLCQAHLLQTRLQSNSNNPQEKKSASHLMHVDDVPEPLRSLFGAHLQPEEEVPDSQQASPLPTMISISDSNLRSTCGLINTEDTAQAELVNQQRRSALSESGSVSNHSVMDVHAVAAINPWLLKSEVSELMQRVMSHACESIAVRYPQFAHPHQHQQSDPNHLAVASSSNISGILSSPLPTFSSRGNVHSLHPTTGSTLNIFAPLGATTDTFVSPHNHTVSSMGTCSPTEHSLRDLPGCVVGGVVGGFGSMSSIRNPPTPQAVLSPVTATDRSNNHSSAEVSGFGSGFGSWGDHSVVEDDAGSAGVLRMGYPSSDGNILFTPAEVAAILSALPPDQLESALQRSILGSLSGNPTYHHRRTRHPGDGCGGKSQSQSTTHHIVKKPAPWSVLSANTMYETTTSEPDPIPSTLPPTERIHSRSGSGMGTQVSVSSISPSLSASAVVEKQLYTLTPTHNSTFHRTTIDSDVLVPAQPSSSSVNAATASPMDNSTTPPQRAVAPVSSIHAGVSAPVGPVFVPTPSPQITSPAGSLDPHLPQHTNYGETVLGTGFVSKKIQINIPAIVRKVPVPNKKPQGTNNMTSTSAGSIYQQPSSTPPQHHHHHQYQHHQQHHQNYMSPYHHQYHHQQHQHHNHVYGYGAPSMLNHHPHHHQHHYPQQQQLPVCYDSGSCVNMSSTMMRHPNPYLRYPVQVSLSPNPHHQQGGDGDHNHPGPPIVEDIKYVMRVSTAEDAAMKAALIKERHARKRDRRKAKKLQDDETSPPTTESTTSKSKSVRAPPWSNLQFAKPLIVDDTHHVSPTTASETATHPSSPMFKRDGGMTDEAVAASIMGNNAHVVVDTSEAQQHKSPQLAPHESTSGSGQSGSMSASLTCPHQNRHASTSPTSAAVTHPSGIPFHSIPPSSQPHPGAQNQPDSRSFSSSFGDLRNSVSHPATTSSTTINTTTTTTTPSMNSQVASVVSPLNTSSYSVSGNGGGGNIGASTGVGLGMGGSGSIQKRSLNLQDSQNPPGESPVNFNSPVEWITPRSDQRSLNSPGSGQASASNSALPHLVGGRTNNGGYIMVDVAVRDAEIKEMKRLRMKDELRKTRRKERQDLRELYRWEAAAYHGAQLANAVVVNASSSEVASSSVSGNRASLSYTLGTSTTSNTPESASTFVNWTPSGTQISVPDTTIGNTSQTSLVEYFAAMASHPTSAATAGGSVVGGGGGQIIRLMLPQPNHQLPISGAVSLVGGTQGSGSSGQGSFGQSASTPSSSSNQNLQQSPLNIQQYPRGGATNMYFPAMGWASSGAPTSGFTTLSGSMNMYANTSGRICAATNYSSPAGTFHQQSYNSLSGGVGTVGSSAQSTDHSSGGGTLASGVGTFGGSTIDASSSGVADNTAAHQYFTEALYRHFTTPLGGGTANNNAHPPQSVSCISRPTLPMTSAHPENNNNHARSRSPPTANSSAATSHALASMSRPKSFIPLSMTVDGNNTTMDSASFWSSIQGYFPAAPNNNSTTFQGQGASPGSHSHLQAPQSSSLSPPGGGPSTASPSGSTLQYVGHDYGSARPSFGSAESLPGFAPLLRNHHQQHQLNMQQQQHHHLPLYPNSQHHDARGTFRSTVDLGQSVVSNSGDTTGTEVPHSSGQSSREVLSQLINRLPSDATAAHVLQSLLASTHHTSSDGSESSVDPVSCTSTRNSQHPLQ